MDYAEYDAHIWEKLSTISEPSLARRSHKSILGHFKPKRARVLRILFFIYIFLQKQYQIRNLRRKIRRLIYDSTYFSQKKKFKCFSLGSPPGIFFKNFFS